MAMTLMVRHHILRSLTIWTDILFRQLRNVSGKFSSFVLIRVVRLTIETNTLTGIYHLEDLTQMHI